MLAAETENDPLDRDAIIEGFARGLARGRRYDAPYLHHEFQPFSPALYALMLANMPAESSYFELRHPDAIRPDNTSARLVRPIKPNHPNRMPAAQKDFWEALRMVLCGEEIKRLFLAAFESELKKRFDCPLAEVPAVPKLMLMRDLATYKINIHHDAQWKTITTQYYLPPDDSQAELGTGIYGRGEDGKLQETHRMAFTPGNAYAFAVSKYSWHGVKSLGEIVRPRNSMMLIYFGDDKYEY